MSAAPSPPRPRRSFAPAVVASIGLLVSLLALWLPIYHLDDEGPTLVDLLQLNGVRAQDASAGVLIMLGVGAVLVLLGWARRLPVPWSLLQMLVSTTGLVATLVLVEETALVRDGITPAGRPTGSVVEATMAAGGVALVVGAVVQILAALLALLAMVLEPVSGGPAPAPAADDRPGPEARGAASA